MPTPKEHAAAAQQLFAADHAKLADQIAAAEERMRQAARSIDDARWALDSARSKLRKAQPGTGYRSTAKLGDAPWNLAEHESEVRRAEVQLLRVCEAWLKPDHPAAPAAAA